MGDVVGMQAFRARRFARELDMASTVGDLSKINPMFVPGRDAGSISDLIGFAKQGEPKAPEICQVHILPTIRIERCEGP